MALATSMGSNILYIRKGDRNNPIDYTGILEAGVSAVAGIAMSLNGGGRLVPGITASGLVFFAMSGTDENNYPDVRRDRGMPYAGQPRFGTISALMNAELTTTGFDSNASYTVGMALTAVSAAAATAAERGIIRPVAAATDIVIGYVSAAAVESEKGYPVLSFYTAFRPGTTVPASLA